MTQPIHLPPLDELQTEIEHALDGYDQARDSTKQAILFDATVALLIRFRLPIDADRVTRVVADSQLPPRASWLTEPDRIQHTQAALSARRCARHIYHVAREKSAP